MNTPHQTNQSVVGQTTDFTCGPAALATLLTHYYGRPASEEAFTERSITESRNAPLQGRTL
ncbi:cysteine peptidase family C39 domain-containing protein [Deinococcus terrestris]|uniref:hypothetical protein n=1 Tax=Deinococcus terrestris TaxID=2651870 RepID=UPI0018843DD0|nr:hypothetical protein [Deinococcus terrestris]